MDELEVILDENPDPALRAQMQKAHEQHERNRKWLTDHWPDLLPQALGKYVAVAGGQVIVADTLQEAVAWAHAHHPDDHGRIVRYVRPDKGPRIYGNRGTVGAV
jgi:hypothetical protein